MKYLCIIFMLLQTAYAQGSFNEAKEIAVNSQFNFKIERQAAKVFFKFKLDQTAYVRIKNGASPLRALQVQASFFNEQQKLLAKNECRLEAGTYFLQLQDQWDDAFSDKELSAKVEFFPETDAEIDSFKNPRKLSVGLINFVLMPLGDADYFSYTAPGDGYLRLSPMASGIRSLDAHVEIFSPEEKLLGRREARLVKGQSCVVKISDLYKDMSSPKQLSAKVEFFPEMDKEADSFKNPRKLSVGLVNFALMPLGDADYFSYTAPGDGYLRLSPTASGIHSLDAHVEIFSPEGKLLGRRETRLVKDQSCVVKISDLYNDMSSPKQLSAKMEFFPEMDEEADSFKNPRKLSVGLINFALMPLGDADYFSYTAPGDGYLRLSPAASGIHSLDAHVEIFSPEAKLLGRGEARLVKDQSCVVKISDLYNDMSSPKQLSAKMEFFPEMDVNEVNNSFDKASIAAVGSQVALAVMPLGDVDYFKIDIPSAGVLSVSLPKSSTRGLRLHCSIFDEGKNLISNSAQARFAGASTAYVCLQDDYHNASSAEMLTVKFSFERQEDMYEPNNTAFSAASIEAQGLIQGRIFPIGDRDFYEFEVREKSILEIDNIKIPQGLRLMWDLLTEEGKLLQSRVGRYKLLPGKYLLRAYASYSQQSTEFFYSKLNLRKPVDPVALDGGDHLELELNTEYRQSLVPTNDSLFWRLNLAKAGIITLKSLGAPGNAVLYFDFLDKNGKTVKTLQPPCRLTAGTHDLRLRTVPAGQGDLVFSVQYAGDRDAFENNDDFSSARQIDTDKDYEIFIYPAGDRDLFKFSLQQKCPLQISAFFKSIQKPADVNIQVYSKDQQKIDAQKSSTEYWRAILEPGDYYVEITCKRAFEIPVSLRLNSSANRSNNAAMSVSIIGLKLNDKARLMSESIAAGSGSAFINSDADTTVSKALESTVSDIVEPLAADEKEVQISQDKPAKDSQSPLIWLSLIAVFAMVLFVLIKRAKKT